MPTNSTFSISVGGVTVATDSVFRVIATVSVSPVTATVDATEPTLPLVVSATDSAGVAIAGPNVRWSKLSQNCPSCGTADSLASIDANGVVTRGGSGKTGSVLFGVGIAPMLATASVTVN